MHFPVPIVSLFRASEMKMINFDLNPSGEPDSWFDFWHMHVDWKGQGNRSWKARKSYLNELVRLFHELKNELKHYPKDY